MVDTFGVAWTSIGSTKRRDPKPYPALGAIAVDNARRARGAGKRHIGVRSEQVQSIAGQPDRLIFRSPVEDVQRNIVVGAPSSELGAGRSIDVDLPGHSREGCEVVPSIDRHPGQSIAAMDMTGGARAERAAAI